MRAALAEVVQLRTFVLERYAAVGSTAAKIPIAASKLPTAVLLVDARPYFDMGASLTLTPNFSFVWDSGSQTAQVYEPSGLTANTVYQLTYLVIGG